MTALSRILFTLFVYFLVLGLSSFLPNVSFLGWQAHADTSWTEYGTDGGYGEDGGPMVLVDKVNGTADYLSLYQHAIGGSGGYGDNLLAPGKGGLAKSILNGLSLGTYYTNYTVNATGGQGGWGLAGSAANGGVGGRSLGWLLMPWWGRF